MTQILWNCCFSSCPCNCFQCCLNFLSSSLLFICTNNFISLLIVGFDSFIQVNCQLLIYLSYLFAKIPASCVYDKIIRSIRHLIHFNKMISTPQCSQASLLPFRFLQIPETPQLCQFKSLFPAIPYILPRWYKVCCLIQFCKIYLTFPKFYRVHSTSNVHSHNIGNCLVLNRHCCTYGTALSDMNVWHNTYLRILSKRIITHPANLPDCFILNHPRITNGRVYFPFNLKHFYLLFFFYLLLLP